MIAPPWLSAELGDEDHTATRAVAPTLVSLHFLRTALRRRWLACALSGVLGLLAAAAFMVVLPPPLEAETTLVLSHDQQLDPSRAMATDVALLETRTVAVEAITRLGLAMKPDDFLSTVTSEPVSSDLLSLKLEAPTSDEAVRRLQGLSAIYLEFRAEQLTLQSKIVVEGLQARMKELQVELEALSRRIEQLSVAGRSSSSEFSEAISQRAYVQGRIDSLQQSVEDATLRSRSVVSASRVLDPAAATPGLAKRNLVLGLVSGLIGGIALGCGTVLFLAIVSDRLRRRSDVAEAIGVPVAVSVGRITPVRKRWLWLPPLRAMERRRSTGRDRLAKVISTEVTLQRHSGRLAVACVDNSAEVGFAVATAAAQLTARGVTVLLIDLTERRRLCVDFVRSVSPSPTSPIVVRPRGAPALATHAADLVAADDQTEPSGGSAQTSQVTLVLADLDPAIGADHLKAWADRVIVAVTAGESSAEKVRTVADLVRAAGLELRIAALLHAERGDDSSGVAGTGHSAAVQLLDGRDQTESLGKSEVR